MSAVNAHDQTTPYGAREYYSWSAEPHFKWFDSAADEAAFLDSPSFLEGQWIRTGMWCCCACIADTPVAVSVCKELVKNLKRGDAVLAGNLTSGGGGVSVSWSESHVGHAGELHDKADIDPGDAKAVLINFGAGTNIIVSSYQLMMTTTGKLKQALRLSLGDQLLSKSGAPITINEIKLGDFKGPRYHIGTDHKFENKVDGHLLSLNDIVIADYVLQKHRTGLPGSVVEDTVA